MRGLLLLLFISQLHALEFGPEELNLKVQRLLKFNELCLGRIDLISTTLDDVIELDRWWRLGPQELRGEQGKMLAAGRLGVSPTSEWRCSDYADALFLAARATNHKLAVGVVWYWMKPEAKEEHLAHAICIFVNAKGDFQFYDPMFRCERELTKAQLKSIYHVRF